jgi:peptide/nickel transport system permease protein
MIISMVVALPVGILAAMYQDRWPDYVLRLFTIAFLSIPSFWIATLLLLYGLLWFGWSPPIAYKSPTVDLSENLQKMLPAAMILGITLAAPTGRVIRSQMLEVLRQDYIRTARAKGLRDRAVVWRHALKNAMIPVITVMGTQFGFLLGGVVIMETIFGLPGLGRYTIESITQRDYPQLQANVLVFAVALLLINLVVDISYAWFDPRIRYR